MKAETEIKTQLPINNKPIKVLLVEDDADDRRLVERLLAECSEPVKFVVESVGNPSATFKCLGNNEYDIVLFDLMLPDSAGIETVRSISSINPYLAIVVLIGSDDDETVEVDIVRYSGESVIAEIQVVETDWDNKSVYLMLLHDCLIPA